MGKPRPEPISITDLHCAQADIGDQLKRMFGDITAGPLPSRLLDLADALEEAFQRGELSEPDARRPRAS